MKLFGKYKKELHNEEQEIEDKNKEPLTPYEHNMQQVLDSYSEYDDEQLFLIKVTFDYGQTLELNKCTKFDVAWLMANVLNGAEAVLYTTKKRKTAVCINLNKFTNIKVDVLDETQKEGAE